MLLRTTLRCALGALLTPALAAAQDDPERSWELVQGALLTEVLDGDLGSARERYASLVRSELPAGDPSLALAQFRLGEVCWVLGDPGAAREVLDACIRAGVEKARCLDLRSRIDLEADAVHVVPTEWTFADAHHGFLHPRAWWDKGSIRLVADNVRSELVWSTQVDGSQEDVLVMGFRDPTPAPRVLYLRLTSTQLDATIGVEVEDLDGHTYAIAGRDPIFPRGQATEFELRLVDMVPLLPGTPPLDPSRLHRLYLLDRSGRAGQTGANELRIDVFGVR